MKGAGLEIKNEKGVDRMWEVDSPMAAYPSGGYLMQKYHYYPRPDSEDNLYQHMYRKTEDRFVSEDETGALCGFCGQWKEHSKFSANVIPNDGTAPDTKICLICDKSSKMLISYANEEHQKEAHKHGFTLARNEDLGRMMYSKSAKDVVRFTKEGYMYAMCQGCYVWKPKSSYFFRKYEFNPKKPYKLIKYCKYCEEFSSKTKKHRQTQRLTYEMNPEYKEIATSFCLYRIYPKQPERKDLIRIFSHKGRAMSKLRELALRYDPGYEQRGYTAMFMVKRQKIDIRETI